MAANAIAKPAKAPILEFIVKAMAVPIPWDEFPITMPWIILLFTPKKHKNCVPNTAPIIPVITAKTAVSDGIPPIFSDMPVATGVVTEREAKA